MADVNEDNDELHEESTLYTDENIEEVLGKDEDEVETMVDDEPQFIAIPEEEKKIQKELEIFTPKLEATELLMPLKPEISEKSLPLFSNYENVFITNQVRPVIFKISFNKVSRTMNCVQQRTTFVSGASNVYDSGF